MNSAKILRRNIGALVVVIALSLVAMPAAAAENAPDAGVEFEIGLWTWLVDTFNSVTNWFSPTPETFEGLAVKSEIGTGANFGTVSAQPGPEVTGGDTHASVDPNG